MTDGEPLTVAVPLVVGVNVVEPVVERDTAATVPEKGAEREAAKEGVTESEGTTEGVTLPLKEAVAVAGALAVKGDEGDADTVREAVPVGLCEPLRVAGLRVGEVDKVGDIKLDKEVVEEAQGDTELEALSVTLPLIEPVPDTEPVTRGVSVPLREPLGEAL